MKGEATPIPWQETWLTAEGVAVFTGFSKTYITNVLAKESTFPPASRRGVGPRAWKAGDIDQWMRDNIERRHGRPREN